MADNFTCGTKPLEWTPPTGKLTAHQASGASYQGLDNHLYRVEIHDTGAFGTATFKWSRDNGSVVTAITEVKSSQVVVVENFGPDDARGFANGQWVEIVDEWTELNGHRQLNKLVQISGTPDPGTHTITLSETVNINLARHPKLRRWDGYGTTVNGWIPLEYGIEVQFSNGNYHNGDYWLIPTRPGSTLPGGIEWPVDKGGNPIAQQPRAIQNRDGHHYCPLALLVLQSDNTFQFKEDCRARFHPQGQSYYRQIADDAFGTDYALDGSGRGRPEVSLRAAINAMLRGRMPTTPALPLTTATATRVDVPCVALAEPSGLWVLFRRSNDIWCKHYNTDNPADGWGPDTLLITTSTTTNPVALRDQTNDLWVFWDNASDGDIWYKRYSRADGRWDKDPTRLPTNTGIDRHPVVLEENGVPWVFWSSDRNGVTQIWHKRYSRTDNKWGDDTLLPPTWSGHVHFALRDQTNDIWLFLENLIYSKGTYNVNILYKRYSRADQKWEDSKPLAISGEYESNSSPVALEDNQTGDLWVVWAWNSYREDQEARGILYKRYSRADDKWEGGVISDVSGVLAYPAVLQDQTGNLWVFWADRTPGGNNNIWYKRYSRADGRWDKDPTRLTTDTGDAVNDPVAVKDYNGELWVFWTREDGNIWYKKFILEI